MKSIAIAALLGAINATRLTTDDSVFIQFTNGAETEVQFAQTGFVDDSERMIEDTRLLHLEEHKFEEKLPGFHGYTPEYSGFEGNNHNNGEWRDAYERKLPAHFEGEEGVDTFTAKMIKEFALEGQDEDTGKPNGHFTVSKANTQKAALEVLDTHCGLKGADADAHLAKYFDKVWEHFDVNNKGALEAVELNHFMRDLAKPIKEHINLE